MSEAWKSDPRFADTPNLASVRLWILMALGFVATFLLIRRYSAQEVIGGKADFAWTLTTLDGQPVELAKYRGRPIFLNIWATWCGPCMREMPSIAALASNPRLAGKVEFLCVSVDETIEPVQAYAERTKPPMTILRAASEPPTIFRTEGIPATFVIAPDGRIVQSVVGGDDWNAPAVVRMLEGLAAEIE